MSKSSSIFTTLPKVKMYCMTQANSHMLRIFLRRLVSAGGSDDSISSRSRFRGAILTILPKGCRRYQVRPHNDTVGTKENAENQLSFPDNCLRMLTEQDGRDPNMGDKTRLQGFALDSSSPTSQFKSRVHGIHAAGNSALVLIRSPANVSLVTCLTGANRCRG